MQGNRLCVQAEGCSSCLDAQPAALHLTPDNQQPSTAHHRRQIHTYSLELLMMGIEVPETCGAYHKCNKAYSDI
jgi:hypothetical protein